MAGVATIGIYCWRRRKPFIKAQICCALIDALSSSLASPRDVKRRKRLQKLINAARTVLIKTDRDGPVSSVAEF